jgi:hypothetical protein
MPSDLTALKARLVNSPAARARFLADTLDLLAKQGVDIEDADVLKSTGLSFDLSNGGKFVDESVASTNIITITQ